MVKSILGLVLIFSIIGCSKSSITLKDDSIRPFKDFSEKTIINTDSQSIQISEIIDLRDNQGLIGIAKTGVKYKDTPVQTPQKLEGFLYKYFNENLKSRGINILENSGTYSMKVKVNDLWLEELSATPPEVVKCKANFTFELEGINKSWKGNFWNEIISPGDLADGTSKMGPTLASCLNFITEKLVKSQKFREFITN